MILGNNRGVKTGQWFSNEILRMEDINYVGEGSYQNFTDLIAILAEQGVAGSGNPDIVLAGCLLEWNNLLTCDLRAGALVSFTGYYMSSDGTWGWQVSAGDIFGVYIPEDTPVAFDTGGASDRIDTLEVRPIQEDYNAQSRQFKDPITEVITSAVVKTKTHYGFEFQILKGTEGAGIAPTHTVGWIKIAEIEVDASATSIAQADIKDVRDSDLWTTEADDTLYKEVFVGEKVTSSPTGGTATSLDKETTIKEMVDEIFARLRDLSGVQDDAVRERHIDLGVDVGDVDADVVPLGTAITSSPTGGTATSLAAATFIRNAIQTAFNRLIDLSGVGDGAVINRHILAAAVRAAEIDFGVAAGDVDADILPLGTAITSSPTGGTNTNLANSSFVRAAIQAVFNRLIDLSGVENGAVDARHFNQTDVTPFIQTLLDDPDAATARATLDIDVMMPYRSFTVETGESVALGDFIELLSNGKIKKWIDDIVDVNQMNAIYRKEDQAFQGQFTSGVDLPSMNWMTKERLCYVGYTGTITHIGTMQVHNQQIAAWSKLVANNIQGHSFVCQLDSERWFHVHLGVGYVIPCYVSQIAGFEAHNTGAGQNAGSGSEGFPFCSTLSADKVFLSYSRTDTICARIATISALAITLQTEYTKSVTTLGYLHHLMLSSTKVLMIFRIPGYIQACVATISGNAISFGTVSTVYTPASGNPMVFAKGSCAIDSTHALVLVYNSAGNDAAVVITESGGSVSGGTPVNLGGSSATVLKLARCTSQRFVSSENKSTIGFLEVNPSTFALTYSGNYWGQHYGIEGYGDRGVLGISQAADITLLHCFGSNIKKAIGVATEAKTAGQSCKVAFPGGVVTGLSGIVAGKLYGWDIHGNRYDNWLPDLQYRDESNLVLQPIAKGLSTTELLVLPECGWRI